MAVLRGSVMRSKQYGSKGALRDKVRMTKYPSPKEARSPTADFIRNRTVEHGGKVSKTQPFPPYKQSKTASPNNAVRSSKS